MYFDSNYLVLLVGMALLSVGLYQWVRFIKLRKSGIKIKGTIYDLVTRTVGEDDVERTFFTIKFITLDNQQVIKDTDIIASDGAKYTTADTVNVIYDPRDPENCIIYEKEKIPYQFLAFLIIGFVMVLFALLAIYTHNPDMFSDGE